MAREHWDGDFNLVFNFVHMTRKNKGNVSSWVNALLTNSLGLNLYIVHVLLIFLIYALYLLAS